MRRAVGATQDKPRIRVDLDSGIIAIGDLELDVETLCAMADPDARVLWAFIREPNEKRIQAVPYNEEKVIWLEESDLMRGDGDVRGTKRELTDGRNPRNAKLSTRCASAGQYAS